MKTGLLIVSCFRNSSFKCSHHIITQFQVILQEKSGSSRKRWFSQPNTAAAGKYFFQISKKTLAFSGKVLYTKQVG